MPASKGYREGLLRFVDVAVPAQIHQRAISRRRRNSLAKCGDSTAIDDAWCSSTARWRCVHPSAEKPAYSVDLIVLTIGVLQGLYAPSAPSLY